ncbi:MAG: UDP-2,3-diacylglucosamine diphosphatase [Tatlockia sp.]|nr:UDP-2,3-diacylglucosamine diphosphatase [Tatlockia sp.]
MLEFQKSRFEAVFISDLHLHPTEQEITSRFNAFIDWAALNTKAVYILGDFFHAWAGDDELDSWSELIANRLKWLSEQQVSLFYMHGNRDFLLGEDFAKLAGMTILPEPSLININDNSILLAHGDRYCTNDKSHQRFRKITRSTWFKPLFLNLPLKLRLKMVNKVRQHSQANSTKTADQMDIVAQPMLEQMQEKAVTILIHGHTHKPGLRNHVYNKKIHSQYVLSDWDDSPSLLCYSSAKGLEFNHDVF